MRIEGDTRTRLLAVAMTAPAAIPASAQVGDRFLQVQRENALALRKYQWKSRVEVRREGETSGVQIFLMRHGVDGSVQKTPIGGTPPPDRPRGPLKKKIAEKKVKAYQELVKELSGLAQAYASLPPDRMQALVAGATMTTPLGAAPDYVQIQARNVLQQGDSLTLWIDPGTHRQQRVEVRTFLETRAVAIVSEFRSLPGGPSYAARTIVDYPSESLQVVTDSYDYEL